MGMDSIPLFAVLKGRMDYLNQRQKVIAENVANADVAGFTPKDLKPQNFSDLVASNGAGGTVQMTTLSPGHLGGTGGFAAGGAGGGGEGSNFQSVTAPDSETKMNGNSVVLEEEMLKMSESRMAYEAAIGFYQHSLNMLRMAAKRPGS